MKIFFERVPKPFERMETFSERVPKLPERVTLAVRTANKRLVNGIPFQTGTRLLTFSRERSQLASEKILKKIKVWQETVKLCLVYGILQWQTVVIMLNKIHSVTEYVL